jgi:hypothetical protein
MNIVPEHWSQIFTRWFLDWVALHKMEGLNPPLRPLMLFSYPVAIHSAQLPQSDSEVPLLDFFSFKPNLEKSKTLYSESCLTLMSTRWNRLNMVSRIGVMVLFAYP